MLKVGKTYRNYNFWDKKIIKEEMGPFVDLDGNDYYDNIFTDHEGNRYNKLGYIIHENNVMTDSQYARNLDVY